MDFPTEKNVIPWIYNETIFIVPRRGTLCGPSELKQC